MDDTSTIYVKIESVLSAIKSGKWKHKIEQVRSESNKRVRDSIKFSLPNAAFCGTFEKKRCYNSRKGIWELKSRRDDHIISYNKLVVIDIDQTEQKLVKGLQDMLPDDPYVYSYFLSPSGGIKILYKVTSDIQHHKLYAFEQVKQWVEEHYKVTVDPSGKNISRICYISYDPDLYYNPDCEEFPVDTTAIKEEYVKSSFSNNEQETNLTEIYKTVKGWMETSGEFYKTGNRNNYIHKVVCILNRAGLTCSQIEQVIIQNHSINNQMLSELRNVIKGVHSRNSHEFGLNPIYSKSKKKTNDLTSFL